VTRHSVGLDSSLLSHPTAELIPFSQGLLQFKACLALPFHCLWAVGAPATEIKGRGAAEGSAGARAAHPARQQLGLSAGALPRTPRLGRPTPAAGDGEVGDRDHRRRGAAGWRGGGESQTLICDCKQLNSHNQAHSYAQHVASN